jgi:hypothetical protein
MGMHPEISEEKVVVVVVVIAVVVVVEAVMLSNSWTPTCGRFLQLWFRRCLSQCLCDFAPDVVK